MAWMGQYNFLLCFKHQIYASKRAIFRNWLRGDYLVFCVNNQIAALAEVSGESYTSEEPVWLNKTKPHKIPLKFVHAVCEQYRLPFHGAIENALETVFGKNYKVAIVSNKMLPEKLAGFLYKTIFNTRNDFEFVSQEIDYLIDQLNR